MHRKVRNCLFTVTAFLLISSAGVSTRAEAAKNTDTTGSAAPVIAAANKDIVAMVNGTAITRKQFDNAMDYQLELVAMRGGKLSSAQLSDLKYEMLESLIDEELMLQESRKNGIKVTPKEIDEAYAERKQKAQFETDAEFEEALKKSNKSVTAYRAEIERGLAIDRFVKKKIADNTVVPDSDAKQYYESNPAIFHQPARVRVSHIMARVAENADQSEKDEATRTLEEAIKRLNAGEDFAAVASDVSSDGNSKNKGGDLGYISEESPIQKPFKDAVFALKKGETSGIVQTSAGYHILKATDRTEARTIGFEEAKDDIVSSLKSNLVNNAVSSYAKDLKNRSTIVKYPIIY